MKKVFLILVFLLSITSIAQKNDFVSCKRSKVEMEFSHLLSNENYIIYSTPKKLLLFIMKSDEIYFYFEFDSESDESDYELNQIFNIDPKIGNLLFNKDNYIKGYIDFNSEFYKEGITSSISSSPLYFSYNESTNQKFCEYHITVVITPSPIEKKIAYILYLYLVDREKEINKII